MRATAVVIGALVLGPAGARAQTALTLRFDPAEGATVHRVFQVHSRLTVLDGDSTWVRETADLGGVRQVVVRRGETESVVHLTFDSLRVRAGDGTGRWREMAPRDLDALWLQARLDRELRVLAVRSSETRPAGSTLLELVTGLAGMALPAEPVEAGDEWPLETEMPLAEVVFAGNSTGARLGLPVSGAVAVDSIVPRALDTLAYLSVNAQVEPGPVGSDGDLVDTGALSGTLVWSTGWCGFVAAATRVSVRIRRPTGASGSGAQRSMLLETTVRQRVSS